MKDMKHRLSLLMFATALLFAQAALLHHEYDFAAHKSGDTCVICLHATPLSHGMSGTIALALPLPVAESAFQPPTLRVIAIAALTYWARAPPFQTSA